MVTGLGMTETAPFAIFTNRRRKSGHMGLPTPGMELKLVPSGGKTEVRYQGPEHDAGLLARARRRPRRFDDEGFFCTGDAVQVDRRRRDAQQGLKFDGRIAEDFKLATGTFVSVGPLRAKIIAAGAPYRAGRRHHRPRTATRSAP